MIIALLWPGTSDKVRVKAHRDSQNSLCREGAPDAQSCWLQRSGVAGSIHGSWIGSNEMRTGAEPILPVGPAARQDPEVSSAQGGDHRGCHDPVYEGGGSSLAWLSPDPGSPAPVVKFQVAALAP